MDATNDVVLTAMKGAYSWEQIKPFVNSLRQSGFRGKKVILAHGLLPSVAEELKRDGFELWWYDIKENRTFGSYCSERFWPANEYLTDFAHEYRYIIWVDWKDLVIQSDPSAWLESHMAPYKIIGCTEGMKVKEEFYNNGWMKQAAPDHTTYAHAREGEICCAGTLAGESGAMKDLLCEIYRVLSTSPNKPDYEGGITPLIDQGILNYLLRISPFKEMVRVPSMDEGFCATCNWWFVHRWSHKSYPTINVETGVISTSSDRRPFCIVHQYDRDPVWNSAVKGRYQ